MPADPCGCLLCTSACSRVAYLSPRHRMGCMWLQAAVEGLIRTTRLPWRRTTRTTRWLTWRRRRPRRTCRHAAPRPPASSAAPPASPPRPPSSPAAARTPLKAQRCDFARPLGAPTPRCRHRSRPAQPGLHAAARCMWRLVAAVFHLHATPAPLPSGRLLGPTRPLPCASFPPLYIQHCLCSGGCDGRTLHIACPCMSLQTPPQPHVTDTPPSPPWTDPQIPRSQPCNACVHHHGPHAWVNTPVATQAPRVTFHKPQQMRKLGDIALENACTASRPRPQLCAGMQSAPPRPPPTFQAPPPHPTAVAAAAAVGAVSGSGCLAKSCSVGSMRQAITACGAIPDC